MNAVTGMQFDAWLAKAEPGERFVYWIGVPSVGTLASERFARVKDIARHAHTAGLIRLHLRRNPDSKELEYLAVRRP